VKCYSGVSPDMGGALLTPIGPRPQIPTISPSLIPVSLMPNETAREN